MFDREKKAVTSYLERRIRRVFGPRLIFGVVMVLLFVSAAAFVGPHFRDAYDYIVHYTNKELNATTDEIAVSTNTVVNVLYYDKADKLAAMIDQRYAKGKNLCSASLLTKERKILNDHYLVDLVHQFSFHYRDVAEIELIDGVGDDLISYLPGNWKNFQATSNAFHILISTRKSDINDEYYGSEGTYKYEKGQPHFLLRPTLIVYVIGKETAQLATRMIKRMTELCGGSAVVKGI